MSLKTMDFAISRFCYLTIYFGAAKVRKILLEFKKGGDRFVVFQSLDHGSEKFGGRNHLDLRVIMPDGDGIRDDQLFQYRTVENLDRMAREDGVGNDGAHRFSAIVHDDLCCL